MEKIRIDIVPGGVTPVAHASQNDVGRSIRFNLFSGVSEYTLTGSEAINISMRRPDGTLRTQGLTNTMSNYVVFTTVDGDLTVGGVYSCELTIYKGDAILGSRNFVLKVEPDAYDGVNVVVMDCGPADICTFETNLADTLVSLTAEISASGGNGSPDSPIPIVGHSELNLVRCGVNVYDEESEDGYIYNGNLYPSSSYKRTKNYISVIEGATYKFVGCTTDGQINCFDSNKTFISAFGMNNTFLYTMPSGTAYIKFYNPAANFGSISMNYPSSDTSYHAYNGTPYLVSFGQTVYGGVYDANRGKVKPNVYYPSYNGETINGRWLSSKDVYVEGNTPTTGAQVVCLDEYDTEIDVLELSVAAIVGTNNITSDCNGDVTASYKVSIQKYVDDQ